jgi:hypothetical protein
MSTPGLLWDANPTTNVAIAPQLAAQDHQPVPVHGSVLRRDCGMGVTFQLCVIGV